MRLYEIFPADVGGTGKLLPHHILQDVYLG